MIINASSYVKLKQTYGVGLWDKCYCLMSEVFPFGIPVGLARALWWSRLYLNVLCVYVGIIRAWVLWWQSVFLWFQNVLSSIFKATLGGGGSILVVRLFEFGFDYIIIWLLMLRFLGSTIRSWWFSSLILLSMNKVNHLMTIKCKFCCMHAWGGTNIIQILWWYYIYGCPSCANC